MSNFTDEDVRQELAYAANFPLLAKIPFFAGARVFLCEDLLEARGRIKDLEAELERAKQDVRK